MFVLFNFANNTYLSYKSRRLVEVSNINKATVWAEKKASAVENILPTLDKDIRIIYLSSVPVQERILEECDGMCLPYSRI